MSKQATQPVLVLDSMIVESVESFDAGVFAGTVKKESNRVFKAYIDDYIFVIVIAADTDKRAAVNEFLEDNELVGICNSADFKEV
jgi:hypothetical protein